MKIFEFITEHPGAKAAEELQTLLQETSEEMRMAALQKVATCAQLLSQELHCSICGASEDEVKKLITFLPIYINICNECVDECSKTIANTTTLGHDPMVRQL